MLTLCLQSVEDLSAGQAGLLFLVQGASAILSAGLGSRGIPRERLCSQLSEADWSRWSRCCWSPPPRPDQLPYLLLALGLLGLDDVRTF